jgi:hypothetical protein
LVPIDIDPVIEDLRVGKRVRPAPPAPIDPIADRNDGALMASRVLLFPHQEIDEETPGNAINKTQE